jgi:hypothetical protein
MFTKLCITNKTIDCQMPKFKSSKLNIYIGKQIHHCISLHDINIQFYLLEGTPFPFSSILMTTTLTSSEAPFKSISVTLVEIDLEKEM